jgi:hypothetical protein
MKKMALYFIMIFAILSCSKEGTGLVLNDPVNLYYNRLYNNGDHNISIMLDSVTQDSRCPSGVECIWAGNAVARFIFIADNNSTKFSLNTLSSFRRDTTIAGFKIELLSLKPYPEYPHPIKQEDYIAEIKITS